MKVSEIVRLLDAEVLTCEDLLSTEVMSACGSDMMSDVLAYVKDQGVLITGLVNPQVVRTAEMMDMLCVVFCRGKKPDQMTLKLAADKGIILLSTQYKMFQTCGELYKNGLGAEGK